MDKLIWRILMWIWVRRAKRAYDGPGERGELFNTANFQLAAGKTIGQTLDETTARVWLYHYDYTRGGTHGCHWFKSRMTEATKLAITMRAGEP